MMFYQTSKVFSILYFIPIKYISPLRNYASYVDFFISSWLLIDVYSMIFPHLLAAGFLLCVFVSSY